MIIFSIVKLRFIPLQVLIACHLLITFRLQFLVFDIKLMPDVLYYCINPRMFIIKLFLQFFDVTNCRLLKLIERLIPLDVFTACRVPYFKVFYCFHYRLSVTQYQNFPSVL